MATIYDLLAKISWDTNSKELEHTVDLSKQQSKMLEELRLKGDRLEKQIVKTNDPVKLKKYNDELQETARRANAITAAHKKQADSVDGLVKKQKDFLEKLKKANDPKAVQGLLRGLHQVENQLAFINKQATVLPSKMGNIGKDLLSGFAGGLVGGGIVGAVQMAFSAISSFVGDSIAEFEDAQKTAMNLNRTLKVIGKEKYFDGIVSDATILSEKFHNLFDNDDIIKAQTALVNYGKVTRNEIKQLTPVILELAAAEGIDLAQATDKIIGIMEGRGGQTLREYGLSVKGVKSEHDRLNLILGEFQTKLKGSADLYASTASGIKQANAVILADTKEKIGENLLPIYTGFLKGLNDLLEGDFGNLVARLGGLGAAIDISEKFKKEREAEARAQVELRTANVQNIAASKRQLEILGLKNSAQYRYLDLLLKQQKLEKDEVLNPNAALFEATEKVAKKASEKKVKIAKKESIDLVKLKEDEFKQTLQNLEEFHESEQNKLLIQLSDKKLTEDEYRDKTVEEDLAYYHYRITAYLDYGKNIDRISNEQLRKLEEYNKRARKSPKGVTGEFVPGTQGDTAVPEGFTSAFASDPEITAAKVKQAEINKITADGIKERNRLAREEVLYNTQLLAGEISNILSQETARTDKSIALQEKRIDEAKKSSTASVKLEEDRLQALLEKRQKYERAQRIIDAAVIVANQAVAISAAIVGIANAVKDGNAILVAANVVAVLAGLTAGYAAVRSINADQGFYEGGYTGDGDPRSESTAQGDRGYKYHKKEFVMNEKLTSKHKNMFEGLHNGELMVQQMGDRYLLAPSIDVDSAVSEFASAKSFGNIEMMMMANELSSIKTLLQERELTVNNNFDADGFGQAVAGQMREAHLKNLMR